MGSQDYTEIVIFFVAGKRNFLTVVSVFLEFDGDFNGRKGVGVEVDIVWDNLFGFVPEAPL